MSGHVNKPTRRASTNRAAHMTSPRFDHQDPDIAAVMFVSSKIVLVHIPTIADVLFWTLELARLNYMRSPSPAL